MAPFLTKHSEMRKPRFLSILSRLAPADKPCEDSIKHQARNIAWRYNDGESNYNPFARRSRSYVGRPEDEENNLQRRHTADQVMSDGSIRRNDMRNVDNADFAYPHHANTAPPESSTSSDTPTTNGTLVGQSDTKPSGEKESLPLDRDNSRSMSEKNVSEPEHKPRKRLAIMNLLGAPDRTKTDNSDLERSDTGESKKKKRRPKISIVSQFKATILGSWVNVLLVCVPIGFALRYSHSNGYAIFIVNFIAIIPLAAMLSFATEELALYTGETLGGLLNASFGNATELIVSIIALAQNKILIVQTSLIGSMLSNLLLVLGMCFFFGGINRVVQHFNITVAQTASSMLAVSIGSLIIPTAFQRFGNNPAGGVAPISRGTAIILLLVYFAYLIFQLKTHVEIYNTPSQKSEKKKGSTREKGETLMGIARIGAGTAASAGGQVNQSNLVHEEEEEETPALSIIGALITLTIATVFIAFNSEFMVSGIDYIVEQGGVSEEFVGLILVPIVGNAAGKKCRVLLTNFEKANLANRARNCRHCSNQGQDGSCNRCRRGLEYANRSARSSSHGSHQLVRSRQRCYDSRLRRFPGRSTLYRCASGQLPHSRWRKSLARGNIVDGGLHHHCSQRMVLSRIGRSGWIKFSSCQYCHFLGSPIWRRSD